jgi:NAD(P)-dependent dehydrogenase (short-subunit alcohol dehydrogenase family)
VGAGSLQNRAALVTGTSSGIGAAVARAPNAWGANVAPTYVTDREKVHSPVTRAEEELGLWRSWSSPARSRSESGLLRRARLQDLCANRAWSVCITLMVRLI